MPDPITMPIVTSIASGVSALCAVFNAARAIIKAPTTRKRMRAQLINDVVDPTFEKLGSIVPLYRKLMVTAARNCTSRENLAKSAAQLTIIRDSYLSTRVNVVANIEEILKVPQLDADIGDFVRAARSMFLIEGIPLTGQSTPGNLVCKLAKGVPDTVVFSADYRRLLEMYCAEFDDAWKKVCSAHAKIKVAEAMAG